MVVGRPRIIPLHPIERLVTSPYQLLTGQFLGYFYLIEGEIELNGEHLTTGNAAKVLGDGLLTVSASNTSELIFVDTPL